MILTGETDRRTARETCPSATVSTTKLSLTDFGPNPSISSERPAINRLSQGTTLKN